jgi:hypothetical protein
MAGECIDVVAERTPFAVQVLICLAIAEGKAWYFRVHREGKPIWPVLRRLVDHHRLVDHGRGGAGLSQQVRREALNAVHIAVLVFAL